MTEFNLTPNEPIYEDNDIYSWMYIYNPVLWPGWNLKYQSDNNKVYMNQVLGFEPAPNTLSTSDMMKFSGVFCYIHPKIDLSLKQYLIIFKVEKYRSDSSNTIEIFHNSDKVATEVLDPGDDRFVLVVDGGEQNDTTNLFFRAASGWPFFWFKEIEVQVI